MNSPKAFGELKTDVAQYSRICKNEILDSLFYSKAKIMLKAFYATVPNYCTFFQFLSIIVAKSGYVLS